MPLFQKAINPGDLFNDIALFQQAMTHPSITPNDRLSSNQRLEFLGDKVINMLVADILFNKNTKWQEGELSRSHAYLVSAENLANIAKQIGLTTYIKYQTHDEINTNVLADALEAFAGALYLDKGYTIVMQYLAPYVKITSNDVINYKSLLQEKVQQQGYPLPLYTVVKQEGKAHQPTFTIEVMVKDLDSATAVSNTRKNAEQLAAKQLLAKINI